MATLKIKFDLIILLRKLKNQWIWILFFRVPKIWHSGLPYLRKPWIDDFLFHVILWSRVLKYRNKSQKSSKHNFFIPGFLWLVARKLPVQRSANVYKGGEPQVPLLGPGNEIKSPNWACRDYRTLNWKWWGHPALGRWPGPGQLTTGASSRPWGWDREPKLGK